MMTQGRTSKLYGALLLSVVFFETGLVSAQQVTPPVVPPPLLPKPEQPLKIPPQFQAGAPQVQAEAAPVVESASRLKATEGAWRQKKVSLDLKNAPVAEALTSVAKQAGLGIAIASSDAAAKLITLSVVRQDASEVLDLLLELGGLNAELRGGILYVTNSVPVEPPPRKEAEPRRADSDPDVGLKVPGLGVSVHVNAQDTDSDWTIRNKDSPWHHGDKDKKAERVLIGKPVRVEAGERVNGVVSIGDTVTVVGHVTGDAVSVGGSVVIEPTGVVDGDAVAVGGTLEIQPGGQVKGDQVNVGIPFFGKDADGDSEDSSASMWLLPGIAGAFTVFGILGALLRAAVIVLAALLALFLAPKRVEIVGGYLRDNPGFSFGGGLLMYCLGIPLVLILALTLVGIPIALLVIVALFVCAVLGMASLLVWLGERIPYFRGRSRVVALLVGAAILAILSTIPFFGCALQVLVTLAASGAAVLTRFGSRPDSSLQL